MFERLLSAPLRGDEAVRRRQAADMLLNFDSEDGPCYLVRASINPTDLQLHRDNRHFIMFKLHYSKMHNASAN